MEQFHDFMSWVGIGVIALGAFLLLTGGFDTKPEPRQDFDGSSFAPDVFDDGMGNTADINDWGSDTIHMNRHKDAAE